MKKIGKIIPLVVGLFIVGCSSDKEQQKVLESFNKGEDIKCWYGAARYTSIISNKCTYGNDKKKSYVKHNFSNSLKHQ